MPFSTFLATTSGGLRRAVRMPGGEWETEALLAHQDVRCLAVDPLNDDLVWAGTQGEGVLRSDDGGRTWRQAGLEGRIVKSLACSKVEPGVVYAGTKPPQVYVRRSGEWIELEAFRNIPGRSLWRQPAERPSTAYVQALAVSPTVPGVIVAGMEAGAVVRSGDGGATWSRHLAGSVRDCHTLVWHATDGDWVYEGGGGVVKPGVAVSRDAGVTWVRGGEGFDRRYGWAVAADPLRPEIVYVSVSSGPGRAHAGGKADSYIFRTMGDGRWEPLERGLPQSLEHMPYALLTNQGDPGHLWAGLADGTVWHSDDMGGSFVRLPVDLGEVHRVLIGF